MLAWRVPGGSGQYLKLSSWMFLEPGLDFDHVQLSFLLDFYLTDAKLRLIFFLFVFFSPPPRVSFAPSTEENITVQPLPRREATCFSEPVYPFGFVRRHFQAQNDAAA